jgi:hypothetical protein
VHLQNECSSFTINFTIKKPARSLNLAGNIFEGFSWG